jgi:hypothetical protein
MAHADPVISHKARAESNSIPLLIADNRSPGTTKSRPPARYLTATKTDRTAAPSQATTCRAGNLVARPPERPVMPMSERARRCGFSLGGTVSGSSPWPDEANDLRPARASALSVGVGQTWPSRQDCAMFAGGPFLGCAGGPLP